MRPSTLWRYRRPLLRCGLFLVALGSVGAALYAVQPPEPRWQREDGLLAVFNTCLGRIATYRGRPNGNAGPVQLLDASSGAEIGSFLSDAPVFKGHAHSADGRYFVAVAKGPQPDIWQIRGVDLHEQREWQADIPLERFESATFSPRCDYVALNQPQPKGTCYALVETGSGRISARVQIAETEGRAMFSRDGSCFFVAYHDEGGTNYIRAVDTRTGRVTKLDNASLLAVAPDGRSVIADCGEDGVWIGEVADGSWRCCLEEAKRTQPRSTDYVISGGLRRISRNFRYRLSATTRYATAIRTWTKLSVKQGISIWADYDADGDRTTYSPDGRYVLWRGGRQSAEVAFGLHDTRTGRRLWQRSWPEANLGEPLFTRDSRQLLVSSGGRVEVVDVTSGITDRTIELAGLHGDHVSLSADGRTLVVSATVAEEEPSWLWAHVLEWLPERPDVEMRRACVFDLETGTAVGEVTWEQLNDWWLTDDCRCLITVDQQSDESGVAATVIYGWDVPRNKPLRWALGVPLGLGVALLSLRQGWRRWRKAGAAPTKGD
jgi:hypothetical protein